MNKQKLEEDIKKRRTSPYFSNTYDSTSSVNINQMAGLSDLLISIYDSKSKCCSNPKEYKNGIGKMVFWSCKNCGADLGDVND